MLIARYIVVSIACLVLLSCATQPKESNDPVYIYDGGRVSVVDVNGLLRSGIATESVDFH